VAAVVAACGLLAGCGSSLIGSASPTDATPTSTTAGAAPSTTVPIDGEVAVAFPVVACTNPAAGGAVIKSSSGWSPSIITAPVPTSLVGKVTFYTDGVHILLAPSGWTCALVQPGPSGQGAGTVPTTTYPGETTTSTPAGATTAATTPGALGVPTSGQGAAIGAPGATTLAVYPSDDPNPPTVGAPAPGTEGVFATWATTGTDAGIDLVCPFFTIPSWQSQQAGCSTTKPAGELMGTIHSAGAHELQ